MKLEVPPTKKYQYSPLRYPGGKASLYPLIEEIVVVNKLKNLTYVEPFAGGAAVALALLMLEKVKKVVINDFDVAIYAFWKAILNDTDRFVSKIRRTPITVTEWRKQKKIYEDKGDNYFALGFATFFLNRTNRSGVLNAGPIGGHNQTGEWKIDARFNKKALIERIKKISHYRARIILKNEDGIKLSKRFLGKDDVFIFLDPPYYAKGSCLYLNHYKDEDHKNLAKLLNAHKNGRWLLTYDNVPQIKRLYPDRKISTFLLNYHVSESRKGSEILIMSDKLTPTLRKKGSRR